MFFNSNFTIIVKNRLKKIKKNYDGYYFNYYFFFENFKRNCGTSKIIKIKVIHLKNTKKLIHII